MHCWLIRIFVDWSILIQMYSIVFNESNLSFLIYIKVIQPALSELRVQDKIGVFSG